MIVGKMERWVGRPTVALGVCAREEGWEDSQDVLCRVEVGASGQELEGQSLRQEQTGQGCRGADDGGALCDDESCEQRAGSRGGREEYKLGNGGGLGFWMGMGMRMRTAAMGVSQK